MSSVYRLSRVLAARILGVLVAVVGGLVILLTLAVALLHLSSTVLVVGIVVAVLLLLLGGLTLTRGAAVVRLDDEGYRVRLIRGAGVTQARWLDVEDVVATVVAGERCIVIRLRDGRTTTVPVRMLAGTTDDFLQDLQGHLNRGHGYRRIG